MVHYGYFDLVKNQIEFLESLDSWISVKRLPEGKNKVLVYSSQDDPYRIVPSDFVKQLSEVTHWMELPKPPKDEK